MFGAGARFCDVRPGREGVAVGRGGVSTEYSALGVAVGLGVAVARGLFLMGVGVIFVTAEVLES